MILRTFFDEKLAQASYLIGCAATGEAIVIDALRDIAPYLEMADAQNLRITAVTETHIHADYLSGSRELAAATGAQIYLSDEGDELWKYEFAAAERATLLHHGDVISVGNLTFDVLHTPGHTPEHIAFLLRDRPMGDLPHSLFTGDFVFVGDVGRPDLLERAANFAGTMEKGARTLFQSLQKLSDLPDSLLLWPAHGAGSACGKALGGSPVTTIGYERATNWAFQIHSEDKFVDEVLSGQPEPPVYFKEMKRMNKVGPRILGSLPIPARATRPTGRLVDVRTIDEIRGMFLPGALAIPKGKSLTNWAGWLLDYVDGVTLIAVSQADANQVARDLATIGLDVVENWIKPNDAGIAKSSIAVVTVDEVRPEDLVLDIRGINERRAGFVAGSIHIPLGELPKRLQELPRDRRILVHCAAGGRSPIAYSILVAGGFHDVRELPGGMAEFLAKRPQLVSAP